MNCLRWLDTIVTIAIDDRIGALDITAHLPDVQLDGSLTHGIGTLRSCARVLRGEGFTLEAMCEEGRRSYEEATVYHVAPD